MCPARKSADAFRRRRTLGKLHQHDHVNDVTDGLPLPRRRYAIAALSAGNALVMVEGGIVNVALPTIARDLHTDGSAAVLVVTVYQLVLVMLLLPFSSLGERIGLSRLYQWGQALFALATLLCFFANSLPFLLVVRVAQPIGAAAVLSVSSALVRSVYPQAMLGRGLALNAVVITFASAIAPTIGGFILSFASWPWVFAATLPLAMLSLAFGRALPTPTPNERPYDLLSALLSAATFGLIVGGFESGVHGDSPVVSAAIVLAGIVIAVVFVRRELGLESPVMPVDLLGQPVIALSAAGALCGFIASMTLLLSMPFRLEHGFGFSPETVGAMMAPWPFVMMFVAPAAGALSDRYPAGLLGGVGMAVAVIALALIAFIPPAPTYWDIAWRMGLCGAGFGLFLSPNARLMIGSAPRERAASAGGLVATTRLTGQTLGATLAATLLATGLGTGKAPALLAAALALIAGIVSISRLNPALRKPERDEMS